MEPFWISTLLVGAAEIGDKTQLLSILLAARYGRPVPIIRGILAATLANHALAVWLGAAAADFLRPDMLRWIVGVGFLAMAAWALIPDKPEAPKAASGAGVFAASCIAFFLAEMGDKTQIATALMGARFEAPLAVLAGSTTGMLAANIPAVLLAERALKLVPLAWARIGAALLFAALGVAALLAPGLFGTSGP